MRAPVVTAMPPHLPSIEFALAGMDASADLDAQVADAVAGLDGTVDRPRGAVEGGVEAVAGGVVLNAAPPADASRTVAWCRSTNSFQARSPSRACCSVEPTMSVNSTVERIVSRTTSSGLDTEKPRIASSRGWFTRLDLFLCVVGQPVLGQAHDLRPVA